MSRWPSNEVWEVRRDFNRAPRQAIFEYTTKKGRRRDRIKAVAKFITKMVVVGGLLWVIIVGMLCISEGKSLCTSKLYTLYNTLCLTLKPR